MYRKRNDHPSVISIWSAPKYLTHLGEAAVLKCDGKEFTARQFKLSPHPYRLPNFMDVFSWTIPVICEKGEPTRPRRPIVFLVD